MSKNSSTDWIAAICAIITIVLTIYLSFFQGEPSTEEPSTGEITVIGNSNVIGDNNSVTLLDPNKETLLPIHLSNENVLQLAQRVTNRNVIQENSRVVKVSGVKPYFVALFKMNSDRSSPYLFQSYKYVNEKWSLSLSDTLLQRNFDVVGTLKMYSGNRQVDQFYDYEDKNSIVFSGCISHRCDSTFGFYCYFPQEDKGYMGGVDHKGEVVLPSELLNDFSGLEYFEEQLTLSHVGIKLPRNSNFPELSTDYKKFFGELPVERIYPNHISTLSKEVMAGFDQYIRGKITSDYDDIFGAYFGKFFNNEKLWYAFQLVKLDYYDTDKYLIDASKFVLINSEDESEYLILEGDNRGGEHDILSGDSFKIVSSTYENRNIFGFIAEKHGGKVPTYIILPYELINGSCKKIEDNEVCKHIWDKYVGLDYYYNCR